jgi:SWI/SNF-related matrix-associated actin-dependent regulator 1 of chromatin subfamily A
MKNKNVATISRNENGDKVIRLSFSYDLDMLQQVRSIIGRKYHKQYDCWSIPLYDSNIKTLIKWGFTIDSKLDAFFKGSKVEEPAIEIPGLQGVLRPFQSVGVSFIEDRKGKVLVADEMGLGKTIESLAWLQLHRERIPVLIVCPSVAKLMWERTANKWLPEPNTEVLYGESPWIPTGDILIINYDILPKWIKRLKALHIQVLIIDEVHYIKSDTAKRTKACKRLAKRVPHVLGLSGTPIENRPIEIYNIWHILDPVRCPDYWHFTYWYCDRKKGWRGRGWDVSGHSNEDKLNAALSSTIMLRRKKVDVLKELPAKVGSFVPILLHNKKEYKAAEADFIAYLREKEGNAVANKAKKAETLVKIAALKRLAVEGKLPEVIEWIKDFLEVEDKLVVFAWHTFVIDALMEAFPNISVKLDGRDNEKQKQKAEDEFQTNPKIHLFVGQMKAAGVVITLTAASNVAIIEYPWNPALVDQAIDRLHRIGQLRSVTYYYLMTEGTIEEKIAYILDDKRKVSSSIIDGEAAVQDTLLKQLIKEYREGIEHNEIMKRTIYSYKIKSRV